VAFDPLEIVGGIAIGTGVGQAVGDVVTPKLQDYKNTQRAKYLHVPLSAATAAEVAAEEVDLYGTMETQASYSGFDAARFADLYRVTLTAPGVGMLLELLRRSDEVPIDFTHGLRKAKLANQWDAALRNLRDVRIPGPDLAYMVVRGVVPNDGTLPSPLPTTADRLQLPPQLKINTLAEAAKTGWDAERFGALVARSGLAMAPVMAAQANFRGILTDNDYLLTIARGDLFPAFADPVREVSRQILTSTEYAELELRGYLNRQQRLAGTARHGMSPADSDLLHSVLGRPLNVHQITTGLARGGHFHPQQGEIRDPYEASVHEANIKPAYYDLAIANRYTYSVPFWWRALSQASAWGSIDPHQILLNLGNPPDFARVVTTFYVGATPAAADPNVKKAHTKAWTEAQSSYIAAESTQADVQPIFTLLGIDAPAAGEIITAWNEIRALVRKQLSPKEIKKAYSEGVLNPATGALWTLQDAMAALLARGYSSNDATTLLEE